MSQRHYVSSERFLTTVLDSSSLEEARSKLGMTPHKFSAKLSQIRKKLRALGYDLPPMLERRRPKGASFATIARKLLGPPQSNGGYVEREIEFDVNGP